LFPLALSTEHPSRLESVQLVQVVVRRETLHEHSLLLALSDLQYSLLGELKDRLKPTRSDSLRPLSVHPPWQLISTSPLSQITAHFSTL
ncbi:hypothetical protein CH063_14601, partial [Colletotrichum higginsianum]